MNTNIRKIFYNKEKKLVYREGVTYPIFSTVTRNMSSHCVIELSIPQWYMLKDNSIRLSYMVSSKSKTLTTVKYKIIPQGSNVMLRKKSVSNGKFIWCQEVDLCRMKYSYFLLTVNKDKLPNDDGLIILNSYSIVKKGVMIKLLTLLVWLFYVRAH